MEQEIRMEKRQAIAKRWEKGEKEDLVIVERTAWSFLPKAKDVVIQDGYMIYMN